MTVLKHTFRFLFVVLLAGISVQPQGIRDRIRQSPRGTRISEAQAADVTLTLTAVEVRPIQQIVRTGGAIDTSRRVVTASVSSAEGPLIQVGQRVRAFPPESKASMYQARVTRVGSRNGKTVVEVTLSGEGIEGLDHYVVEITVERGDYLSIPSEAIIEEGDHRIAYVQQEGGDYVPRTIETGMQGERYTQILGGLKSGEQVVTFGSFFIDSNYKLKSDQRAP